MTDKSILVRESGLRFGRARGEMKPDGPTARRIHLFAVRPPGRSGRDSDGDLFGGRVFGRVRRVAGIGQSKRRKRGTTRRERFAEARAQNLKKNQYSGLTGGSA